MGSPEIWVILILFREFTLLIPETE